MAHAKLHIICGNCGCNDMFRFHVDPEGHDFGSVQVESNEAVFLICGNCSTLHDLSDNATHMPKPR